MSGATETEEEAELPGVPPADDMVRGPLGVRERESSRQGAPAEPDEDPAIQEGEQEVSVKPAGKVFCPACGQPMMWFGDHWKCTNIKVHDQAKVEKSRTRGES